MADCKNCLHYEVCADVMKKDLFIKEKMLKIANPICKCFLDESKIIELPCKVGDYVYSIFSRRCWHLSNKDSPPKAKVVFVGLTNSDDMGGGYFEVLYEDNETWTFYFSDIGKLVFHIREEAEQALKERESK